ncbi:MAG: hypothetical protein EP344_06545 [Bacteroidetes bacterium]|nr:MAG: hypothetical protein EP344_06545 [Bacteroidota bacterium]
MNPTFALLLSALFPLVLSAQTPTRWYVRANASPFGADGASWATATPYLQDAIDAAQFGDSIWIAQGFYFPPGATSRMAVFTLKNGVRLFGGFSGTETELGQRDWEAYPTVLSGDIGAPLDSTDNAYSIVYAAQTGMSTRLDGLILERGNAGNPDNVNVFAHQRGHSGSAIYLDAQGSGKFAYLTLANCTVRHNRADHFGAIYANGRDNGKATVRIENCRFEQNRADFKGGAIAVENYGLQPEPLLIDRSTFNQNFGRAAGGAIYTEHHQNIVVTRTRFDRNSVFVGVGGAVSLFGDNLSHGIRFEDCSFTGNYTTGNNLVGGAVDLYTIASVTSLQFANCTFIDNTATEGGCVNVLHSSGSQCPASFDQCVFVRNTANPGSVFGGTLLGPLDGLGFRHCLFHLNGPGELFLTGQADTVRLDNSILSLGPGATPLHQGTQPMRIRNCMINRPDSTHFGAKAVSNAATLYNINPYPFFADPDQDDYHQSPCSPAINAGDNALATGLATDLDGQPRILAGTVDLGPWEHALGFVPTSITPASCPESSDGAVEFGGSICAPVFIAWASGGNFGTRTDSLAPGTYIFSFIDAAGHSASDTVTIPHLPAMHLSANVAPPVCFGQSTGVAGINISGGTTPYQILWDDGSTGSFLFGVPAGAYLVAVTDDLGCVASDTVIVPEATPVEVYYTVTHATGPQTPDGAIQIDSVLGCTGVYQWTGPQQTDLLPGSYTTTLTDSCGCFALFVATVDFVISTDPGPDGGAFVLAPNPAQRRQPVRLSGLNGAVEQVRVLDVHGRLVHRQQVPPGAQESDWTAPDAPGVYWIEVRRKDGSRWVGRLLVH